MKTDINPKYQKCVVTCACGETFETRSVLDKINVEICYKCHPFYTGRQKFVDTAGRIEKFTRKYKEVKVTDRNKAGQKKRRAASESKAAAAEPAPPAAESTPPAAEPALPVAEPTPPVAESSAPAESASPSDAETPATPERENPTPNEPTPPAAG